MATIDDVVARVEALPPTHIVKFLVRLAEETSGRLEPGFHRDAAKTAILAASTLALAPETVTTARLDPQRLALINLSKRDVPMSDKPAMHCISYCVQFVFWNAKSREEDSGAAVVFGADLAEADELYVRFAIASAAEARLTSEEIERMISETR